LGQRRCRQDHHGATDGDLAIGPWVQHPDSGHRPDGEPFGDPTSSTSAKRRSPRSVRSATCAASTSTQEGDGRLPDPPRRDAAGFSTLFGSELLSTPCTEEIAAFDQFVSFFDDQEHDKIVFDTARPATLRELSMPFDWSGYISNQIKNRKELSEALGSSMTTTCWTI